MPKLDAGLESSVLKTLAYYQALENMPLTLLEIQKFLLDDQNGAGDSPRLFDIKNTLNTLTNKRFVAGKNGFWALKNNKNSIDKRIKGLKHSGIKWRIIRKKTRFLPYIPYVRSVSITGSVALNHANHKSDIDILIKCAKGKIWTTRIFINLVAFLLKRRRSDKKTAGRLCFNQFMVYGQKSFGPERINKTVRDVNIKIWDDATQAKNGAVFELNPKSLGITCKKLIELSLAFTKIDKILEKLLASVQIKKIKHNPIKYPEHLEELTIYTQNLIFYYPQVLKTEKKYTEILNNYN